MPDARIQLIRSARLRLGESPRALDAHADSYLALPRLLAPFLVSKDLKRVRGNYRYLLDRGRVVWGALVVANNELFARGSGDGRGVVVYCDEFHRHDHLDQLVETAQGIESLRKGRLRDADERELKKLVNNNNAWFRPRAVPKSVAIDESVRVSSVLVIRRHVPQRKLNSSCFPILAHPEIDSVAILPERYWPQEMKDHWIKPS